MGGHWHRLLRSTTVRFVLLTFLFQLPVTGGLLLFVQQVSQRALIGEQKDYVTELQSELVAAFDAGGRSELVSLMNARVNSPVHASAVLLLIGADGRPVVGNIDAWPPTVPHQSGWRTIDLFRSGSEHPERMGIVATPLPDRSVLLIGRTIDASERLAQVNAEAVAAALLLSVLLTFACAVLLGRLLSRQINHIVETTTAVGHGSLTRRVPVDGSGDAFDALGGAINAMLDRIELLVSQLRMMTDGLAHDLKSPVTRLKSVLERAIIDVEEPNALGALERVSEEAETLLQMLSTALLISRADAGIGRDNFTAMPVADLLGDLAEIYGPLIEDRGFSITVRAPADTNVTLHRELMSQAIGNLIENALKYAIGGTRIALSAVVEDQTLNLMVEDDGPGIPADRHEDAIRRFGRLDPARQIPGSGLGLSLVRAAARLHDGWVALEDCGPGLRVRITIPV